MAHSRFSLLLFILATTLGLVSSTLAQSADPYFGVEYGPVGEPSGVSGTSSSATVRLPSTIPNRFEAFDNFTFYERRDEPCKVKIAMRVLGGARYPVEVWNECEGGTGLGSGDDIGVALNSVGPQDWPLGVYLTAVRVCTNNRNNERGELVKGVEFTFDTHPHIPLSSDDRDKEGINRWNASFARNNCKRWRSRRSCSLRAATTQLILHHKEIGGRRSLVGIQLVCHPVEPRSDLPIINSNARTNPSGRIDQKGRSLRGRGPRQ